MEARHIRLTLRGRYTLGSVERLIGQLQPLFALSERSIVEMDLTGLAFMSPAPLAILVSTLADLVTRGLVVPGSPYRPPRNLQTRADLARLDFERLLVNGARVPTSHERRERGLHPCCVFSDHDAGEVCDALSVAMGEACSLDAGAQAAIWIALNEIAQNVVDHAQSPSAGVAVSQRSKTQNAFELALADRGVGIAASLGRNPDYGDVSDLEALRAAVRPGVSGAPTQREGMGLFTTQVLLKHNAGLLVLRSGTAALETGHRDQGSSDLRPYPGTLVALRARLDRPLELRHLVGILEGVE